MASAFDEELCKLLATYRRTRAEVSEGPFVVSERVGRRRRFGLRPFLLYGLDDHVSRRAAELGRRAHADAVETGDDHAAGLGSVEHLLGSLPPVPYRRLYAATVLLVAAAALGVIWLLRQIHVGEHLKKTLDSANGLVDTLATSVLTIDIGQLPDTLKSLGAANTRVLAFVAIIVALSIYAVLRPFVGTFLIRRELLRPGIVEQERRVLGSAPREVPFDLIVYALPMTLPLYVGLYMVGDGLVRGDPGTSAVGLAFLAAPAGARLTVLWRRWERRRDHRDVAPAVRFVEAAAEQDSNLSVA
jgi:hypothetical protein